MKNVVLSLLICVLSAASLQAQEALRLTLPPTVPAVVGDETGIWFDNVVLTEHPEALEFSVQPASGTPGAADKVRWLITPAAADVGRHDVKVTVKQAGKVAAEGTFTLEVVPADAGAGKDVALLIVGDSLTHATVYPNEIARRLSRPGNPKVTFLGTHRPSSAAKGVAHEGYGGWTWARFVNHYEPMPDLAQRKHSSPFVFALEGEAGKAKLNVARYVREACEGRAPDYVTFLLGINDCFSANPDDPADIDRRIDETFKQAEVLLKEFRTATPKAVLGVCLTTPPNSRESGFEANYKGRYHRWGWKRIQHRLVERQLKHFGGREAEGIVIVPTELYLDPTGGYPENNGVHPNAEGYKQIGASITAWLKSRLASR